MKLGKRRYSIDFKKRVSEYAESDGVSAAARKYGISRRSIARWIALHEVGLLGLHPYDYGDRRSLMSCLHCGGPPDSKDHNPSKIFLDEPFPDDLPVVGVCKPCNSSFSVDEPYLACLVEAARTGLAEPDDTWRPKARIVLAHNKKLRTILRQARCETSKEVFWKFDLPRVENVAQKLAVGHAAFELHDPPYCSPSLISLFPLHTLHQDQRRHFETPPTFSGYPEVGSRAMFRMFEGFPSQDENGWIIIQKGRYRYVAAGSGNVAIVRMVLSEYLAIEVIWNDEEPIEVPEFGLIADP